MATPNFFDVIIVGGGPMGLASAYECVIKRHKKVLLLERFDKFAHGATSSPGYSRQFRVSYFEKNLSDLAIKTYNLWKNLMTEMNDPTLLHETGCLWFGDPSVSNSEGNINKAVENLDELGEPYTLFEDKVEFMGDPRFSFVSKAVANIEKPKALFTAKGGTVNVPALVQCYEVALNNASDVTLVKCAQVSRIDRSNQSCIEVTADVKEGKSVIKKTYRGRKIILTPGTYVNEVLQTLNPPFKYLINLTIYLWSSTYFTKNASSTSPSNQWPIWYFFGPKDLDHSSDDPKDYNDYYGFPSESERPLHLRVAPAFTSEEKFDFHDFPPPITDRPVDAHALRFTGTFVESSMSDLNPEQVTEEHTTCVAGFVELTDENETDKGAGFLLDFLPGDKRIVLFTGGWAMKFVPMIGKILSDLGLDDHTSEEYQNLIAPMNIHRGVLKEATHCQSTQMKSQSASSAKKVASFQKIWC